ncbi:MAG: FAD-dependent oxidoreductase, partial [Candidatus Bathyarchaeota archaeon]|nr:FAD-dependent oxidoreductase [Candidatus Bathyarchaeota archaeon]
IREHCSWVHPQEPEKATQKAKEIVAMAVAKARHLQPQNEPEVEIYPSALVIGGGVAGMGAALSLARQGFDVNLVEKEEELGGMLRNLYKLFPENEDARNVLEETIKAVQANERIHVLTSSTVKNVKGFLGNFDVTVTREGQDTEIRAGTMIVATGADYFEPNGMYGYGDHPNVITQLQLEEELKEDRLGTPQRVVMIQCVGSREKQGRTYCSRICCTEALKNAILILKRSPATEVYILYRDMQTYGKEHEKYQWIAREKGVRFVRYLQDRPPEINFAPGKKPVLKVYHALLSEDIELESDLVVLASPLVPSQTAKDLSQVLKVPLGSDGFFLEAHVKLRPVDFAADGIFVCGTAHSPKNLAETIAQAHAAASRASIPLALGKMRTEAIMSVIDERLCSGCGTCISMCPYGAIQKDEKGIARTIDVVCKGCGVCAASCPENAITMRHFTDEQIIAEVYAALSR